MKSLPLAAILTALFTHNALQTVHIVTIKTERILKDSDAGRGIQEKVENEQKKLMAQFEKIEMALRKQEADLIEKQKALAKEEEKFKTEANLLSAEARAEKYDELKRKRDDLNEDFANFERAKRKANEEAKKIEQKLDMFSRREMMGFEQDIKLLIEEISKSEGWDLVLPKEISIYASDATDKTNVVIKKMNDKTKKENEKKALAA